METLLQDVRYALRSLRKSWVFTVVATLTLGLGIGALTAIFSVVNAVLLRPLPYEQPDRLLMLWETNQAQGLDRSQISPGNLGDWREQNQTFDGIAGFWPNSITLRDREDNPVRAKSALVTVDLFSMLGVGAAIGRTFGEDEGLPGAPPSVVLSHGLWQRRFGSDPAIIGESVTIEEVPQVVVGVMPATFDFPEGSELWTNVNFPLQGRFGRWMNAVGRVAPATGLEAAEAELKNLAERMAAEFPNSNEGWGVATAPLHEVVVGDTGPALLVLLAATGAILLIACANVANLLLTQAETRGTEIAVRVALGAARIRVIRQLLTESVVLSVLGSVLGLGLARVSLRGLIAASPGGLPRLAEIDMDGTVLLFAMGTTLLTGVLFGLAPALRLIRSNLQDSLKEGAKGSVGPDRLRMRNTFVVAQLALAAILVIGAGLLLRSFAGLQSSDPGFRADGVLTLQMSLPNAQYASNESVAQFYAALGEQLAVLPGVSSVGMASAIPLGESLDYQATFLIADRAPPPPGEQNRAYYRQVDPGFFRTLGVSLVDGRSFVPRDDAEAPGAVIVNTAFARQFFPAEDPLGEKLTQTGLTFGPLGAMLFNEVEIVGVVQDVKYGGLRLDSSPSIYFPHRQAPFRLMNVALGTGGDPLSLISSARETLAGLDSSVALSRIETVRQIVDASLAGERFSMLLAAVFGIIALVLASVGIYGVLAYTVEHRGRELGIRIALGALDGDVQRLILGQGAALTAIGLGAGLLGAFWLTTFLSSQLYGITARDPVTFVGVALLLGAVSLLASWIPARRALRVDPVSVLKAE